MLKMQLPAQHVRTGNAVVTIPSRTGGLGPTIFPLYLPLFPHTQTGWDVFPTVLQIDGLTDRQAWPLITLNLITLNLD